MIVTNRPPERKAGKYPQRPARRVKKKAGISLVSTENLTSKIWKEAKKFFLRSRGSHDWDHTERVYRLCLRLGKREGADLDILKLAALLHDVGRLEEDKSNGLVCHGKAGAKIAREILKKHKVNAGIINKVIHCIKSHRFRRGTKPKTTEARVLFDADKLDSIGAVGIGRAFLFAGEVGARLHNADTDIKTTKPYTREDTAYREYIVKLRRIKDLMFTEAGRRLAESRHQFMVKFFDRLNRETRGLL